MVLLLLVITSSSLISRQDNQLIGLRHINSLIRDIQSNDYLFQYLLSYRAYRKKFCLCSGHLGAGPSTCIVIIRDF